MNIVAISDMHGVLPAIPPCDLLLIAGDICPVQNHNIAFQAEWLNSVFRRWLESVPCQQIIGVAGNHDFVFEKAPETVPNDLRWTYLQDSETEWNGWHIYGSPWQPWFFDWAFNASDEQLEQNWAKVPEHTDILVCHGPPHGFGDGVMQNGGKITNEGCRHLRQRIEMVQPKLVVFGHIHEGRGQWQTSSTILANVSILDIHYRPVHIPWTVSLEK